MVVTFIGHRNINDDLEPTLTELLEYCITKLDATLFYVGNHGQFDYTVLHTLKKLQQRYPHIQYYEVLCRPPSKKSAFGQPEHPTLFPEGLDKQGRYIIIKRNRWMIDQADLLISYVKYIGNAREFVEYAEKKGKRVVPVLDWQNHLC